MPWLVFVAAVLMLAGPAESSADETSSFVVKLGSDTLSVEQFTRTATQVRGEYVVRSPRASHRTYTIDLDAQGQARRFEMIVRNLGGGPGRAETRSTIDFTGDSAFTMAPRGDSSFTTRMPAARGAAPSIFGVMGLIDQLGRQARAASQPSYTTPLVSPGAAQPMRAVVNRAGGDTLLFYSETNVGKLGPWILRVDEAGRLQAYSGPGTPFQGEGRKVPAVDIAAARAAYSTRPLGQLSVRDTTRAPLGADSLWVDYGRPLKREREIFGNVVPWNAVWRTGANAATQFRTGANLTIGGAAVPAGLYTLWTLPTPGGWKLIINKQTGQWGTVYDAAQDLVRVDMTTETLAEPVERFTIEIEPKGAEATLRLSWDRVRASVAMRRKETASAALPPSDSLALDRLNSSPRHGEFVDIPYGEGAPLRTWVVYPERKDKAGVVILIHEIFGLSKWLRGVGDQVAADGFIAVAPDLISGMGPGGGGTDSVATRDDLVKLIRGLSADETRARLDAVRAWAAKLPAANGKVATMGFCWGGARSFEYAAVDPPPQAAIVFYGTSPDSATLLRVRAPVLGLYGGDDARVNATIEPAKAALKTTRASYEPNIYEGAGHGFLRQQEGRDGANRTATEKAWPRAVKFLKTNLK